MFDEEISAWTVLSTCSIVIILSWSVESELYIYMQKTLLFRLDNILETIVLSVYDVK